MKHVLKKVPVILLATAFAIPAVSFADMRPDERPAPVRHHYQPHHHQIHQHYRSHG
ncbi:hypothetical protein SAMN05446934_9778 [Paraburkholderia hospita]|uniref:hypothetical protein n=1 Tax=Paraburkholderia hospita TaxID=169430 RepID=UPI000271717E|nr:hypothetical protein [Paraburkholderia hospita]EUC21580.1 hypothetical protein PMI06_009046 [Burkholderia sp. BT03]SKC56312.1 hypothetical protein SAMN06266956_0810 [Paraburkholderia hospita]SKD05897.1 hypothetical protein SAMN05446934_9778 [Paraburkholderia hospita]